jgi:manganese/iron transport system ATP-binding protein/manganese/zinc/iron transport system ATP- binding protein
VPVLLEAGALTIRRGRRTVLSGVALTVAPGAAVHVAGANGSGKTSLLRVLAGLAAPRAASLVRHAACAFVPEKVRLVPALRCGEWLRAMRALRGLTSTDWATAAAASGLDPAVLDRPAATLSRGMLQRVALLEALQAGCPLLLLDEPFSGLDTRSTDLVMGLLDDLAAEGRTLLIATHDVDQARAWDLVLCVNGTQIAFGPPEQTLTLPTLERTYGGAIVELPGTGGHGVLPPHHHDH